MFWLSVKWMAFAFSVYTNRINTTLSGSSACSINDVSRTNYIFSSISLALRGPFVWAERRERGGVWRGKSKWMFTFNVQLPHMAIGQWYNSSPYASSGIYFINFVIFTLHACRQSYSMCIRHALHFGAKKTHTHIQSHNKLIKIWFDCVNSAKPQHRHVNLTIISHFIIDLLTTRRKSGSTNNASSGSRCDFGHNDVNGIFPLRGKDTTHTILVYDHRMDRREDAWIWCFPWALSYSFSSSFCGASTMRFAFRPEYEYGAIAISHRNYYYTSFWFRAMAFPMWQCVANGNNRNIISSSTHYTHACDNSSSGDDGDGSDTQGQCL